MGDANDARVLANQKMVNVAEGTRLSSYIGIGGPTNPSTVDPRNGKSEIVQVGVWDPNNGAK